MAGPPCLCHNCFPDHRFDPNVCMYCPAKLPLIGGTLKSPGGARMCVECLKKCYKTLFPIKGMFI
jgi:hypothetical protein